MTSPRGAEGSGPWQDYELEEGEEQDVRVGPLRLDLRLVSGEVHVAWTRAADSELEESSSWQRWAVREGPAAVRLRPAFPDRTLVVAPEDAFSVVPQAEARIYVRVPVWARVELLGRSTTLLDEVPTVVMSNTWWGDLVAGDLCYWLPTAARRVLTAEHFRPHLVFCPILIRNRSADTLEVDRIAVRGVHSSIYAKGEQLWADETQLSFAGEAQGSEVTMTGKAPAEASGAELLSAPRVPVDRGFSARTFARLKSLSGMRDLG